MGATYKGPTVFVDGIHYPIGKDGKADLKQQLLWVDPSPYNTEETGHYEYWDGNGSSHLGRYSILNKELEVGG